jgi:acetyltransferase-like isoleucine patch superfamily enzyme
MEITDNGVNNRITVSPTIRGRLLINGNNNVVAVGAEQDSINVILEVNGSDAVIDIGSGCNLGHLFAYLQSGAQVRVGQGVGFNGFIRLLLHEAFHIEIGNLCLLSGGTDITVSDMHPIFDLATGERINVGQSVKIGEHCWIAQNCLVLKGVTIGSNSAIGASSVVTKNIPANCLAAGVPARVLRENIFWKRNL